MFFLSHPAFGYALAAPLAGAAQRLSAPQASTNGLQKFGVSKHDLEYFYAAAVVSLAIRSCAGTELAVHGGCVHAVCQPPSATRVRLSLPTVAIWVESRADYDDTKMLLARCRPASRSLSLHWQVRLPTC